MDEPGKAGLLMIIKRILRQMGVDREQIQEDMADYSALSVDELEATIARLSVFVRPVAPGEGSSRGQGTEDLARAHRTPIQETQGPGVVTQVERTSSQQRRRGSRYESL